MGWGNKFPDMKNDPTYLEGRVSNNETQLAQIASQVSSYKTSSNTWDNAVSQCLTYCVTNGKPMYFPPYAITLNNPIEINTNNVKIFGAYPLSVINYAGAGKFLNIHDLQEIKISGLVINYTGSDMNSEGLYLSNVMHGDVSDIRINDFGYTNLHLYNVVYYVPFNNVQSRTVNGWGIVLEADNGDAGPNSTTFNNNCRFSGKLGAGWMKATASGLATNNVVFNGSTFEQDSETGKDFGTTILQIDKGTYNLFMGCRFEMGNLLGKTGNIIINDNAINNAFLGCAYFNLNIVYTRTSQTIFLPKLSHYNELQNLIIGQSGITTDNASGSSSEVMINTSTPNAYYRKMYKSGNVDYAHSSNDTVFAKDIVTYLDGAVDGIQHTGVRKFDMVEYSPTATLPTGTDKGRNTGATYFYSNLNQLITWNGTVWTNLFGYQCVGTTTDRTNLGTVLPTGMKFYDLSLPALKTWNGSAWI